MNALIPAYRPPDGLAALARTLREGGFKRIIIVDDGSGPEYEGIFSELRGMGCHVLPHGRNRGKGRALKTGLEYFMRNFPGIGGVITADADGQHRPEDIIRIARALEENPGCLILGARAFGANAPLPNRIGNVLAGFLFRMAGSCLSDTQTGLRGIPAALLPELPELPGERYEFETAVLLLARRKGVEIIEREIAAVYGAPSHFRPLADSARILSCFFRTAMSRRRIP
ncbi:MAG: glycosyltransferase family 2 protein [Elusimicrobiales bacterium]